MKHRKNPENENRDSAVFNKWNGLIASNSVELLGLVEKTEGSKSQGSFDWLQLLTPFYFMTSARVRRAW